MKEAVFRYIDSKKIDVLDLHPLYQFAKGSSFHYNTDLYSLGWERQGVMCYVLLQKGNEDAILYINLKKKVSFITIPMSTH